MASEYWELLRDPRWQRMRLEVMQRADFACEHCLDKEDTLNVHHTYYVKGKKPWEYPVESLKCLCESCHDLWHHLDGELKSEISTVHEGGLVRVLWYVKAFKARLQGAESIQIINTEYETAQGVADAFGLEPEDVLDMADEDGSVLLLPMMQLYNERLSIHRPKMESR